MHLASFSVLFALFLSEISGQIPRPPIFDKLFNSPEGSVSQFPPIIEFFVQKIQSQYSNYIHEDLSRPQTWNKPTYSLSPEDQAVFSSNNNSTFNDTGGKFDADNSTEIFFELIFDNQTQNVTQTTELYFEKIETSTSPANSTVVYITPKKKFTTTPTLNETID